MREQTIAVQRMQDYIEEHRSEELTLSDLARASRFSPWHSHRLFRQYLGRTPAGYIRRLRLSRSAVRLKAGGCHITDVAYEFGFGSVDGYTRAFCREFGCNPGAYAKGPVPIALFIPYGVKCKELREEALDMEHLQSVFVQVVCKPRRNAIIKRGIKAADYMSDCEEAGCDVWGLLSSMDSPCGEPVCLWPPEAYRKPDSSVYGQGFEAPSGYSGIVPEGFDVIALPEAGHLVFQGEPFRGEAYSRATLAVQHAMGRYDPSLIGYAWDDSSPRIPLEPRGERGYIEMRAVKRRGLK